MSIILANFGKYAISDCPFICLFVCVCLCGCLCLSRCLSGRFNYEGLVPRKQNILQVHCWGCLVVQVMFHALMTSLMTSQDHKAGQIWNWYISVNIWATASIKCSKCRKSLWLSFWYIQLPVQLPVKTFVASSKWRPFWKVLNIKHSFNLTADMKRSSQIMPKKVFSWWWRHRWRHRVATKSTLYIPLWTK